MPIVLTVLINFTVNYLLLLASARLWHGTVPLLRALLSASIGAGHVLACLLTGSEFLSAQLVRLLVILLMGVATFGIGRRAWGQMAVLLLLCFATEGASGNGIPSVLWGILVLLLLIFMGKGQGSTVPVTLRYGSQKLSLTALRDTGNCLKDPVTGASVLVIGPESASYLTGLTRQQLRDPLETMGAIPGLRLIPYKAVGSSGFLLALKLNQVRIGTWQGSHVVAFAPEGLEKGGGIEALVGGNV